MKTLTFLLFCVIGLNAETLHVVFRDKADLRVTGSREERGKRVLERIHANSNRSQGRAVALAIRYQTPFLQLRAANRLVLTDPPNVLLNALLQLPEVVSIVPERTITLEPIIQGDPVMASWGVPKIGADLAWEFTRGEGAVVANIDTGVDASHPALAPQYRNDAGSWYDPTGLCPSTVPCDNDGHGTHTMGTMVGADGVGVAPGAKWIACKGCETNSCSDTSLLACGDWVLDPYGDGTGRGRPNAVNCSWGGGGFPEYAPVIDAWRAAGIFPAFANGNSGSACASAMEPGSFPQAFAVGATDIYEQVAYFSSRGPSPIDGAIKPDLSAPGVDIPSTLPDNQYGVYSGTSMATPHVAGTVALLASVDPSLTVDQLEDLLKRSADHFASSETCGNELTCPNNSYGWGRLNALRAVRVALGLDTYPVACEEVPPAFPPHLEIVAPLNAQAYTCPAHIHAVAEASDTEDGDLSAGIEWIVDAGRWGERGVGPVQDWTVECTAGSGWHTILARVIDSQSLAIVDTVSFKLILPGENQPPVTTILAPTNGAEVPCGIIAFRALSLDPEQGDISTKTSWWDGKEIKFAEGASPSRTFSCDTALGQHTIYTKIVDATNSVDYDQINITVVSAPPPPPITLTPTSVTLAPKGKQQFTASQPAQWTATFGTVSSAGLYTAPAANRDAAGTVRACAPTNTSNCASATVTIKRRSR